MLWFIVKRDRLSIKLEIKEIEKIGRTKLYGTTKR